MKKLIITGALAAVCMIGTAHADSYGQAGNWNGAYVGLEAGYGWGSVKQPYGAVGGPFVNTEANANQDGGIFGGYLGYDWLFASSWLFGIEGNMDWTDIGGNDGGSGGDVNAVNQHWEGSLRGRLGFLATPSILIYMTGGYSFMDASLKDTTGTIESHSTTFDGWTVGGGAEWEINPSVALRLQYRYSDYGTKRVSFPVHNYDIGATPSINAITAGVSFRL